MKKFFGILFACFVFTSCNNFLSDNLDFAKKMSEEVRYNTAAQVLVTVFSESGTIVTGSNRDARVGIPFEIELSLPKNIGVFEKWYAVVRDKNGNDTPLSSSDIVFDNANELKTNVTLLNEIKGVYVLAKVHANPVLSISYDNSDFYSSNSTREAKGLIVNNNKKNENENIFSQDFIIQTLNDYGISFERISFFTSDGVTETKIPVYTLDQFNALGENTPEPYTYILNCEGANPGTEEKADGTYYSSAVTNALLCLFNVSETTLSEGSVKITFNASLFHGLENMLYIRPEAVVYPKVIGNVEGYDNISISPNTQKVILPLKDVPFKISIPDEYTYESLSFITDSGKIPEVYVTESDYLDENLDEVKSASLAVYSLNVITNSPSSYETKTTVSFNVKAINGFSETINVKPVIRKNPVLVPSSKKNENTIEPALNEVKFHPGKDYDFTVSSVSGYNFKDLIFTDESNSRIYTFNQTKYESFEDKPEKYIFITDSKILDESLDSVKNALYAVYNFNPALNDDTGEVTASFKIKAIKGYDEKLKVQADTYQKNSVETPSKTIIIAHPGKEYSVNFSSDNSYTFDKIKISTSDAFIPFYTEDEYNQTKPAAGTYAFYSENTTISTSSEAVKNSLIAIYNFSVSVNEGKNYETITNGSFKFRLINETGLDKITILPERIEKNTLALYADNTEGTLSPASGTEIKMHPGKDYGVNIKSSSTVSFSAIKATSSGKKIPVISDVLYSSMVEKPEPKTYIYLTEDAKLDTDSNAVTNSIFAVYNFNVNPVEKTSNETYTQGNFIIRSMNVVSSPVTIEPEFYSKVIVNLAADSGFISPSSVLSYPGKDYSVTYESTNDYSFTNLIFFDKSNRLDSYTEIEYEQAQPKPENYIAVCEPSFDTSKEYIKNSIVAVYNMNISTEEKEDNELITKCSFIFRNMNPYSGSVTIKPNLSPKTSLNFTVPEGGNISPAGVVKMFPGKDYSVSLQTTNDYSFDTLKFKSDSTVYPVYTSDEYSNAAVKPENYVFLSENAFLDTIDPAYKNSVFAVYNFNKLVTVTGENKSVTQGSFVIRVVKGTVENVTVSPFSILKKNVLFTSDTNSSVTPSGEVKTLSENGVAFSISSSDQYAVSALLVKDASGNILGKYDTVGKTSVPDSVSIYNSSDKKIVQIEDFKLEKNLSKLSGILYVDSSVNESVTITAETKVRPTVQSTDPYSYEKGVMRTAPITIRFSKPMKVFENESSYLNYLIVERYDGSSALDGSGENVFEEIISAEGKHPRYFKNPELKNDGYELLVSPVNNVDESKWMKSGSEIRIKVLNTLTDAEGIPLKDNYTFSYILGTSGDAEGPIISTNNTSLTIASSGKTIDQSVWGDFEPSKNAVAGHTYADSIHVGPDEKFVAKIQASDASTGDTGIKDFVADVRLMYIYEGGRLPNSSEKASKNMILFDKDGNWLYEAGCLKQDFYKEYLVPYTGTSKMADTGNGFNISFDDFVTNESSGSLPVDGIYRIELTARDGLDNYSSNPNVYYVVRDTTPPDAEKNAAKISFADGCGVEVNGKYYFGSLSQFVSFSFNGVIEDFGTQGQPRLTCDNTQNSWQMTLSYSKNVLNSESIIGRWSSFKKSSESITLDLPSSLLDSDKEIYAWARFKDGNDYISKEICLSEIPLYIDVTKPVVSIISNDNDYFYFKSAGDEKSIFLKNYTSYVSFESSDPINSNISSGVKAYYVGLKDSEVKDLVINNKYKFNSSGIYKIEVFDYAGNSSSIFVDVSIIDDSNVPEFNVSHNVEKELTNGKLEFTLEISDNSIGLKDNGIEFTDFTVEKYKIRNSMDEVIQKGELNNSTFIPVKRVNTRGDIFIDVSGKIDISKYPERSIEEEPNLFSYIVDNGYLKKENEISFYLDVTPPILQISPMNDFSFSPVIQNTNGYDEMYFYVSQNYVYVNIEDSSSWKFIYQKLPDGIVNERTTNLITQFSDFHDEADYKINLIDDAGNESNFILHKIRDRVTPSITFEDCLDDGDVIYYYEEKTPGVKVVLTDNDKVDHCLITSGDKTDYKTTSEFYLKGSKEGISYKLKAVDKANLVSEKTVKIVSENANDFYCEITRDSGTVLTGIDSDRNPVLEKKDLYKTDMIPCIKNKFYYKFNCPGSGIAENGIDFFYYPSSNQSSISTQKVMNITVDEKTTKSKPTAFINIAEEISHINNSIVLRIKNRYGDYFYSVFDAPIDAFPPRALLSSTSEDIIIEQTNDYSFIVKNFDWQKEIKIIVNGEDKHNIGLQTNVLGSGIFNYFYMNYWQNNKTYFYTEGNLNSEINFGRFGMQDERDYDLFLYDNFGNVGKVSNSNKPCTRITCKTVNPKKTYSFDVDSEQRPEFEGNWILRNGALCNPKIDNDNSTIETITLNNCNGFKFKYKVSSEEKYDYFVCFLDGEPIIGIDEVTDENVSGIAMTEFVEFKKYYEKSDNHILKFKYQKDRSQSNGDDCVYIDDFIIY